MRTTLLICVLFALMVWKPDLPLPSAFGGAVSVSLIFAIVMDIIELAKSTKK